MHFNRRNIGRALQWKFCWSILRKRLALVTVYKEWRSIKTTAASCNLIVEYEVGQLRIYSPVSAPMQKTPSILISLCHTREVYQHFTTNYKSWNSSKRSHLVLHLDTSFVYKEWLDLWFVWIIADAFWFGNFFIRFFDSFSLSNGLPNKKLALRSLFWYDELRIQIYS